MTEFYHQLITEKSFKTLQDLKKRFDFILIGGWAVYLYSHALKSKDIDIIVDYDILEKIKKEFNVFKNERLKKYEIKIEEVDIDIYLPFFSELGFPAAEIKNYIQNLEGFTAPMAEILLILKTFTAYERRGSFKGEKDLIDIFSLLKENVVDWQKYKEIIVKYKLETTNQKLKDFIVNKKRIPELDLANHQLARLKKKILESLKF